MVTETVLDGPDTEQDVGMIHYVCGCDEDIALCGADVSQDGWTDAEAECIVCADLEWVPCLRCGE